MFWKALLAISYGSKHQYPLPFLHVAVQGPMTFFPTRQVDEEPFDFGLTVTTMLLHTMLQYGNYWEALYERLVSVLVLNYELESS
jgi:hypothetical protein